MLYLLTFGFFIGYLLFLGALVWLFIDRFLARWLGAGRLETIIIFYSTIIMALFFLIVVNYYTGFLADIYHFFDDLFFGGAHTRRVI